MPVKLNSTGGGSVTLTTPSTASDFTATFPAATGNVVTDSATQTLTNKTLSSPLVMSVSVITSGTAQASTSGTSIDFTGIPSWVNRVTIMLRGVSTSGASDVIFQLGSSAGFVTTGYAGSSSTIAATVNSSLLTSGFLIRGGSGASAAFVREGAIVLSLFGSNTWSGSLNCSMSHGALTSVGSGSIVLPGTLDRVRITTVNGTDTFDAGFINILYE